MKSRAAAREATRERIVCATVSLHDEQGVSSTTIADIAERAGVGAATVLRHFPTIGRLVAACGEHVAAEIRPPMPEDAARIFEGLAATRPRLERLVCELDAFYGRSALRLIAAANDRDRIPELDRFLRMIDAGIEAWIREAMVDEAPGEPMVGVLMSLCAVSVWQRMGRSALTAAQRRAVLVEILLSAIDAVRSTGTAKGRSRA
jgi:AcrR family transcriptional regulator